MSKLRSWKTNANLILTACCVWLALGSTALADPAPTAGILEFLDGASLHGRLRSMSPERGVGWEHPEAKQLIQFRPANLASIVFENVKPVLPQSKHTCRFRFLNGDELYGNLSAISEETVELETWFGGNLKAPRDSVQSISFFWRGFSVLYEGPNSSQGWVTSKGNRGWQYRDGSFVTSEAGIIGRDFKLPASSSLAFDLGWSSPFTLGLTLYTETMDRFDYSVSSYMFYVSAGVGPGQISLQRMQSGVGVTSLGRVEIPDLLRKRKVRLEFRSNKEDATLAVLADGQLLQRWKDSGGFVAKGGGVVFSSQMEGPVLRISNLRVAEWDGRFDSDGLTNGPSKRDLAFLINRDKVIGDVQSVRDGKLQIKTPQTNLEIPMQRVSQLVLGTTNAPPSPASPWEVRAHVAGGGTVAFELAQWGQEQVSGTSSTFGQLALNPQSIRQLQFNLNRAQRVRNEKEPGDEFRGFDE
ncbi:MAG: hypothetical protein L0Z50_14835 [Verrucomicrobiales bacterium]|nr:hypothetical protein [Verrucomicrobiales bacterium]